jgi:hypothetical protein
MPHRPTHLAPALVADRVDQNAKAKAARAFFDEFWNTGDEALLKRAFAKNFADRAVQPPRAPATIGLRPSGRLGAPE